MEADDGVVLLRCFKQPEQAVARGRVTAALERFVDLFHFRVAVVVPQPLPADQIDDFLNALRELIDDADDPQRLLERNANVGTTVLKIRLGKLHFHPQGARIIKVWFANKFSHAFHRPFEIGLLYQKNRVCTIKNCEI